MTSYRAVYAIIWLKLAIVSQRQDFRKANRYTIKPLPLDRQDQTAASDLLDTIARTVVEIRVTDTVTASVVVTSHYQPLVEEDEQ